MREVAGLMLRAVAVLCLGAATIAGAQLTTNGVDMGAPVQYTITKPATAQAIPNTVFGSFLEPINRSTYGGLWADVVDNPSFENGLWSVEHVAAMVTEEPELKRASALALPVPWAPLNPAQGARYLPINAKPDAPVPNSYMALEVMGLPDAEVGVGERVYLPAQRELGYHGSIWLERLRGEGTVTVSLRRYEHPEQVLAQATLEMKDAAWGKLPFELKLAPGAVQRLEPVELVLAVKGDARIGIDDLHLFPDDAVDGMDPDVLMMARDLHSPLIRFGGNFTSGYNWRDGIGPENKRISMLNASWGIPEYNTFGTDEFLDFIRKIDAQPQVALNLGSGTPDEAAAWVQYIEKSLGRSGLTYELGNELWGTWQIGYPTEAQSGALTASFSKAVKAVDPDAHLIATGAEPDHFQNWNAVLLQQPAGTFQYLSTHFVVGDDVVEPKPAPDFRTMAALALPVGLGIEVKAIRQQALDAQRPDVKVAFTEWLLHSRDGSGPNFANMGGAVFAGGFLNMILRESDTVPVSDMTGILDFAGIWQNKGQVYASPAYWVLRSYATAAPATLLDTRMTAGPAYSVAQGNTRIPTIADVPYLDVTAALSADKRSLLLFCVNRSLTDGLNANFDLASLGVDAHARAKVLVLEGDSIHSMNDAETPNAVVPHALTEAAAAHWTHRFPAASVTVVTLPLR